MDKMKFDVEAEINDAEVMAGWYCDGTENEDWTNVNVLENGNLVIYDRDYNAFELSLEELKNGCEGVVSIEYLGNGNYKVVKTCENA